MCVPPERADKLAEQIFNGSLAILTLLLAVAGIGAAEFDKISGIAEVAASYRHLLVGILALSVIAATTSLVSMERLKGRAVPIWILLWLLRVLIGGSAIASIWIVIATLS